MYPDRCFVVGRMLFYTSSAVHQISLIPIPREIQNEKDEFVLKDNNRSGRQTTITRRQLLGRPFVSCWRIKIKQYPLFTERGAWRSFNTHDRSCMQMAES